MENDIIGIKIKKFIFHLNKIGLLTEEDNQIFLNNFYETSKNYFKDNNNDKDTIDLDFNDKYIEDNLTKTLFLFLNSLNEEKNKIISLNIYNNFIFEEKRAIKEKGYKVYDLYKKLKTGIFFKKWLIITMNKFTKISTKKDSSEEKNNNVISCNMSINKNPFDKRLTNSLKNNSYNFSNNYSPNTINKYNYNDLIDDIKQNKNNSINLTRNHHYNSLNIGKIIDNPKSNHNQTTSKIDNMRSYTFTNDCSPYKMCEVKDKEKENKCKYYKKEIFAGKGTQLFNKKTNMNKKNKNIVNLKLNAHFEYLGNLSKKIKDHKLIKEKTTEYIKEQEELKNNCTFKPKINNYKTPKTTIKKINYNNMLRTEQLYLDNQKRMEKRTVNIQLRDNKLSKENTFKPKFVSSSIKKLKKNFSLRLDTFNKKKQEKINKIINSIETDYNSICTFTPTLNLEYINKMACVNNSCKNSINQKIPAYQRLYNQSKEKILRQEEKKNQIMEDILFQANNPLIYSNKFNINTNDTNNISKSVDYQKIEELYNDYKKKRIKMKKKQENIDKEIGMTFNPLLINGDKYLDKIDRNFYKREKKFMQNQRNHIEAYQNYLDKEKEKYFKKFYENKKTIVKNVVDRLYKDGLEKTLVKNNTKPNIFSKNYYRNDNKEDCDNNETIFANKSVVNTDNVNNMNNNYKNESVTRKNNIIVPIKNNDD